MTIEVVIDLIEMGAVAPQDIVKCLRSALRDTPQRTWVGLTDEEVARLAHHELWVKTFIRKIEEKLRSKNT